MMQARALWLLGAVACACATLPARSQTPGPDANAGWVQLPDDSYFELPYSEVASALGHLGARSTVALGAVEALNYGHRPGFACASGTHAYLVVAELGNGSPGVIRLAWSPRNRQLMVERMEMGRGLPPGKVPDRTVLLACLPGTPHAVFQGTSGTM